jgi:hypothetical protein
MKRRNAIILSCFFVVLLVCTYFFFRDKFKADNRPNTRKFTQTNENAAQTHYLSNKILVKVKKDDVAKLKKNPATRSTINASYATIDPSNTGIASLDNVNKSLKASKVETLQAQPSTRGVDMSNNNQWLSITLPVNKKIISNRPEKVESGHQIRQRTVCPPVCGDSPWRGELLN